MLSSYWRRQRTDRTISVLTSIAAMIRSGTPITGTVNSQSGNPRAAISPNHTAGCLQKGLPAVPKPIGTHELLMVGWIAMKLQYFK